MLELDKICFSFSDNKRLLDSCSLKTGQGKVYTLMGPNGAGKTTLFNIITGFLKIQSGNIILNDENIDGLSPHLINRKGIGRTFQDLRLITKLSVKDNIRLAIKDHPTDKWYGNLVPVDGKRLNEVEERVNTIVREYFLEDVKDNMAGEISYGQQKLLTIACCVANYAELLLLDEPVAGINPVYRQQIADIIKNLKKSGKTILLIEHNTEFIDEVADAIFFMANGNITPYSNLVAMRADKEVVEAYL